MPDIPYIKGTFRHVLRPPGMRAAQASGNPTQWYINDHCFFVHDREIHWFGITNPYPATGNCYAPGTHRHVGHAMATDPFGPWTEHPHVFAYPEGTAVNIGACFVIERAESFLMLCGSSIGGDGVHLASSKDLHRWEWMPNTEAMLGVRDPCVIPDPAGGYLLYLAGGYAGVGEVLLASSSDLLHWRWEEPALHTDDSVKSGCLESPFVHYRNGTYYLFVNFSHRQYEETLVFASTNPRHFDWRSPVCTLFAHAAEILTWQGRDYISHCGIEDQHWQETGAPYGLWLAELDWMRRAA